MKTKLRFLAVALIAGGTMFAQSRLSIGVGIGGYGPGAYPPPAYPQYQPPCPGPDYSWVDGYWAPQGGRNVWIAGFWRPPVFAAAPRYYNGYRGNDHDRGYDRGHDRREYSRNRGGERSEYRGNSFRR